MNLNVDLHKIQRECDLSYKWNEWTSNRRLFLLQICDGQLEYVGLP